MNVQQVIRNFVIENILFGDGERLEEDVSFHKSGILDSTGYMELIMFVEGEFGVKVADDEVVPENFDTLKKVSAFVEQKLRAKAAA